MGVGFWWGLRCGVPVQDLDLFSLVLLRKKLLIERTFEYNRGMELGDPTATTREPRSRLDAALDAFEDSHSPT